MNFHLISMSAVISRAEESQPGLHTVQMLWSTLKLQCHVVSVGSVLFPPDLLFPVCTNAYSHASQTLVSLDLIRQPGMYALTELIELVRLPFRAHCPPPQKCFQVKDRYQAESGLTSKTPMKSAMGPCFAQSLQGSVHDKTFHAQSKRQDQ